MQHIADENAISFTPDHSGNYVVQFTDGEKPWTEPIIGWAVVVRSTYEDNNREEANTAIQPVVIDPGDGMPATISEYLINREAGLSWKVEAAR